ncbi:MAG: AEC family transporter [Chloroflexota bacterium]
MQSEIIISQIVILAIVVVIGIIAARFRVITEESKDMLSKVIFNISLPLMLFTNFLRLKATPELLGNSFVVLSVSGFIIMFLLLIGWLTSRIFGVKGREAAVFKAHSMFGNTIFLGFPLIFALFGEVGLLYATMFQLVSNIIMWTVGVVVLTYGQGTDWKKNLKRLLNPNTIAIVSGFFFFLLSIRIPNVIQKPLTELGAANTWLSMLYIGAMLYFSGARAFLSTKSIYVLSFNRLVFAPALLIAFFWLMSAASFGVPDKLVLSVIILEASMPCMASVVIMARELGADDRLAVGNVFISTLFSIITLPLVLIAINRFL